MDNSGPSERKKYYINVCRPLLAVPGCDRRASVCQMEYRHDQVSSLSVPAWSWFAKRVRSSGIQDRHVNSGFFVQNTAVFVDL